MQVMNLIKVLSMFLASYQDRASQTANLTEKVMTKWIQKNPSYNFVAVLDFRASQDDEIANSVVKSIPKGFTVMHLNVSETSSDKIGKASFIMIFADIYDGVSEIIIILYHDS